MAARSTRGAISPKPVNEKLLRAALRKLRLGGLRFYQTIGSTSDVALAWATDGARDLSLVCAEEQTQGRGRGDRHWVTNSESALAFSLVLRPGEKESANVQFYAVLGVLAVSQVLEAMGLHPQIKWPNDVLLNRKKVCGILAESVWMGERVDSVVLGIGINVRPESIPEAERLMFPATSLESELNRSMERETILRDVLYALLEWRPRVGSEEFMQAWEERLAFRGEAVTVSAEEKLICRGQVIGLERDGGLRLLGENGKIVSVQFGEVNLRPVV
jgi:BirA family transcriptional regulator, biotin operon repressor / biotin---[acetyl-CoA-carboxylase] ligase